MNERPSVSEILVQAERLRRSWETLKPQLESARLRLEAKSYRSIVEINWIDNINTYLEIKEFAMQFSETQKTDLKKRLTVACEDAEALGKIKAPTAGFDWGALIAVLLPILLQFLATLFPTPAPTPTPPAPTPTPTPAS